MLFGWFLQGGLTRVEGVVLLQERIQNEDMAARWRGDPITVDGGDL